MDTSMQVSYEYTLVPKPNGGGMAGLHREVNRMADLGWRLQTADHYTLYFERKKKK